MSDNDNMIVDAAGRIFQDLCEPGVINDAEAGKWPEALWSALEENGLTLTWVSDERGGAGAEMADGFAVLRVAGTWSCPVPLAETLMAGWLLDRAGLSSPLGPMTVAPVDEDATIELGSDGTLKGSAKRVPFARNAEHVAVLADSGGKTVVALVEAKSLAIAHAMSLAGEPNDDISFDGVKPVATADAPKGLDKAALCAFAAAVRSMQMSGALQKILDQSVEYALERSQFGRPIAKFQAVQHALAELAGEVAAATAAADAAGEAVSAGLPFEGRALADIAAAKIRVGEAASKGAAIAHQAHGAMGFTYEHSLHHATRRLWSWRDEFGNEAIWAIRLGRMVGQRGADELWPFVTGT